MPLWPEFLEEMKGTHADLKNAGERCGGAPTLPPPSCRSSLATYALGAPRHRRSRVQLQTGVARASGRHRVRRGAARALAAGPVVGAPVAGERTNAGTAGRAGEAGEAGARSPQGVTARPAASHGGEAAEARPGDILLRVEGLRIVFPGERGEVAVVDRLDFELRRGEIVGLVGESGSGKTLTALAVLRLVPPPGRISAGRVWLDGEDLLQLSEPAIRAVRGGRIAMVFQEPLTALHPVYTIGFQIVEALRAHRPLGRREARAEALRLLDQVAMPEPERRLASYPHQLSGGQRQRAMIAMALAGQPDLLLADEPTTALDVTIQAQILELLERLRRELGLSVLLITHDLALVAETCDRVCVLYCGPPGGGGFGRAPVRGSRAPVHPRAAPLAAATRLSSGAWLAADDRRTRAGRRRPAHRLCLPPSLPGGVRALPRAGADIHADHQRSSRELLAGCARGGGRPRAARAMKQVPLLEARSLSVTFPVRRGTLQQPVGEVSAVDDVSLSVERGESLALVGESGSGKTTLARALLRLIEPTAGEIRFDGDDLLAVPARELRHLRRHFQMVFQDPYGSLDPRQTVRQALAEPLRIHRLVAREQTATRVVELLSLVGLSEALAARYPHELSGGQRQRVGIARALATAPRLLIADEPVCAARRLRASADRQPAGVAPARAGAHAPLHRARPGGGGADRRSCGGDVPGPHRRAGERPGAVRVPAPSVYGEPAVRGSGTGSTAAAAADRVERGAAEPLDAALRLPLPPPLPDRARSMLHQQPAARGGAPRPLGFVLLSRRARGLGSSFGLTPGLLAGPVYGSRLRRVTFRASLRSLGELRARSLASGHWGDPLRETRITDHPSIGESFGWSASARDAEKRHVP